MKSTNEKSATPDNDYNHSEPINIHLTVYWIYVITCTIMIVSLCSYVGRLSPNMLHDYILLSLDVNNKMQSFINETINDTSC